MMSRSFMVAFAALLFFAAVHLYFLPAPFVSLEFVYGRYAERIMIGGVGEEMNSYLTLVANPLTSLFLIVPFQLLMGVSEFAARLPSFVSGVALSLVVIGIAGRLKGSKAGALAAAMILLNPMYWTCSGLAYTDVPFCFFAGTGMLFCISALLLERPLLHWPAGVALALAALIKYNGVLFFPLAAAFIIIERRGRALAALLPYAVLAAAVDLPAYMALLARYGFLIHPRLQALHRPRPDMVYVYLPSYLLWLGLFMGPLLLFPLWNRLTAAGRRGTRTALVTLLLAACALCGLTGWGGRYLSSLHGAADFEMNLGWFEVIFGVRALNVLILFVLALAAIAGVDIVSWMRRARANLFFGVWLFSILLVGSVSRPANRYLLFILVPLSVYLASIVAAMDERQRVRWPLRAYFAASMVLLAAVCLFTSCVWIAGRGEASAAAVRYLNERHLAPACLDWRVTSHSRYLADESLLVWNESAARYLVSGRASGQPPPAGRVLFRRDASFMGRPLEIYEVIDKGGSSHDGS